MEVSLLKNSFDFRNIYKYRLMYMFTLDKIFEIGFFITWMYLKDKYIHRALKSTYQSALSKFTFNFFTYTLDLNLQIKYFNYFF